VACKTQELRKSQQVLSNTDQDLNSNELLYLSDEVKARVINDNDNDLYVHIKYCPTTSWHVLAYKYNCIHAYDNICEIYKGDNLVIQDKITEQQKLAMSK
ncbi:hypothetical protein GJ496_006214, partial [Pomphorhynchus laevis]